VSPALQPPAPHAVLYWTSPAPQKFCCSSCRAVPEEPFVEIGLAVRFDNEVEVVRGVTLQGGVLGSEGSDCPAGVTFSDSKRACSTRKGTLTCFCH
jgi:hypothetical protein